MIRPSRQHLGFWAFVAHRVSGVALALFLPLHFLALGLALEGAAALDTFLAVADNPLFKVAEWGLVVLLTVHLAMGARVMVLELLPWRDARKGLIGVGAVTALAVGTVFLLRAG
ncbi:MAG: succinate dehydrogenase, cytochrome b556 subunit [Alphaproteobacteria bacterium]|nr:succinate dehydrogenase, cytochrome b556 subunit [Alphaproteobacteria bacterium]